MIQIRRVGVVPSASSSEARSPSGLSQLLKVLDAAQRRFHLPLETDSVESVTAAGDSKDALILDDSLEEAASATRLVPFIGPGSRRESQLMWPAVREACALCPEGWLETRLIPIEAIEAMVRLALRALEDRDGGPMEMIAADSGSMAPWFRSQVEAASAGKRLILLPTGAFFATGAASQEHGISRSRIVVADSTVGPWVAGILGAHALLGIGDARHFTLRLRAPGIVSALAGVACLLDRLGFFEASGALVAIGASLPVDASETLVLHRIIEFTEVGI